LKVIKVPMIFEYEPKNTPIHKLNPVTKVIMLLSLFIVLTIYWDPRFVAIVASIALVLYIISKTPKKWLLIVLPIGSIRFIESLILGISQAKGEYFHYLPRELAEEVIVKVGPLAIVYGGILWTISDILKILATIMLTFSFIYTTSINDIVKMLSYFRVPRKIIYVFIVSLKLVPDILREISTTLIAQKLRGWELKTKNPFKLVKQAAPLAYPFLRKVIGYVDTLTAIAYIRGFGASQNVKLHWKPNLTLIDKAVIAISLCLSFIATYFALGYGIGLI